MANFRTVAIIALLTGLGSEASASEKQISQSLDRDDRSVDEPVGSVDHQEKAVTCPAEQYRKLKFVCRIEGLFEVFGGKDGMSLIRADNVSIVRASRQ